MYAGRKLKELRVYLDKTQSEMAESLGVSQPYYSTIEKGKKPITNKLIESIVSIYKIDRGYFDNKSDKKEPSNKGVNVGGIVGGDTKSSDRDDYYMEYIEDITNRKNKAHELVSFNNLKLSNDLYNSEKRISEFYSNINKLKEYNEILNRFDLDYWNAIFNFLMWNGNEYVTNERFDYQRYKSDALNILKENIVFDGAIKDLITSIERFLKEVKKHDTLNILDDFS